ncbi:MAG: DUF1080 domain-containing protein [Colwellia sp.]
MMTIRNLISFIMLTTALIFNVSSYADQATSVEILINGEQGLNNWQQTGSGNWRAEDGAIVADSGNGLLVSKKSYGNFRLIAEFWADHTTNSGIFIRADNPSYINAYSAYEVNIFDQRSNKSYGTGGIVGVAAVDPMPTAGGKWNTFEIVAKGDQLTVHLNGQQTINISSDLHASGPIALQIAPGAGATGAIKWRKVTIESL